MTACQPTMRDRSFVRNRQRRQVLPVTTEAIMGAEGESNPASFALTPPVVS
jgi:hypothetical protein